MQARRLVGRRVETAAVEKLLGAVVAEGRGGTLAFEGEPGIGKSALTRKAAELARSHGLMVLGGRATAGLAVPFRPLGEVLLALGRSQRSSSAAAPDQLVDRLLPGWRGPSGGAEPSLLAVADALLQELVGVAGQAGVLVVLEDLHWADPETLAVMEYIADNVLDLPLAIITTMRPYPADAAFVTGQLASRHACRHLVLAPLTEDEICELAASCLAVVTLPDEVRDLVLTSADGVPLLAEDLLAEVANSGALVQADDGSWRIAAPLEAHRPRRFGDTVQHRLATLTPEARVVVKAAAVLGRTFDWRQLSQLAEEPVDTVHAALEAAAAAQLLRADGGDFSFRHALTREVVLGQLALTQRVDLHMRAAAALESGRPGADLTQGERVLAADFRAGGGDVIGAAGLLLVAGRDALGRGALDSALLLLARGAELAGEHPLRVTLAQARVEALALSGDVDAALREGEELLERCAAEVAAETRVLLARAAITAGRLGDASVHLDRAQDSGPGTLEQQARVAAVEAHLALSSGTLDRLVAAEEVARRAVRIAEAAGLPEVQCEALEVVGRCARVRDLAQAEAAFSQAFALATRHGLPVWRMRALNELGTVEMFRDVLPDRLEEARREAERIGAVATAAGIDVNLAAVYVMRGECRLALIAADRCAATSDRYHLPVISAAHLFRGVIAVHEGRFADMAGHVRAAEAGAGDDPDILVGTWAMCRAMRSLLTENRSRAHHEFAVSRSHVEDRPVLAVDPGEGPWLLLRAVDGRLGVDELDAYAGTHALGSQWSAMWEGLARSVVARDASTFSSTYDAAASMPLFRMLGVRLAAERALLDGWGDGPGWLAETARFFTDPGHPRVASACRSLLRTAGIRVPRDRRTDRAVSPELRGFGITAREVEVLDLVRERLQNRDIARRLYLSPRTVEKHIASLLAKTGAPDREQLILSTEHGGAAPM